MIGNNKKASTAQQNVRKHFYVSGRVQGVGFRYRAFHVAQMLNLTGWVKNLDDGRVELELQGKEASVREFFKLLEKGSFIRIDNCEGERLTSIQESGFEILD